MFSFFGGSKPVAVDSGVKEKSSTYMTVDSDVKEKVGNQRYGIYNQSCKEEIYISIICVQHYFF